MKFVQRPSLSIEYAIRDVVASGGLEAQGHEILKLNIGDPIAYDLRHHSTWWTRTHKPFRTA